MKTFLASFALSALVFAAAACGPPARNDDDDGNNPGPCTPPGTAEICGDGIDNDCDSRTDCADNDCSGVGTCPICGEGEHGEGSPLTLPDGDGDSYESSLTAAGFGPQQTLQDANSLLAVCVNMEHSWLRDLRVELVCPTGETVVLQEFEGRDNVTEVFMGQPNDNDEFGDPIAGVGAEYCWSATAANPPTLAYANTHLVNDRLDLPAGEYQPSESFDGFLGCMLNGDWTIRVTDLWPQDNGFIFSWEIRFDPGIVDDCSVVID